MNTFRNKQQEDTYNEIVYLLDKHGKCAMERPVGFGKTWLCAKISSLYNKVLFIVPNKEIERAIKEDYKDIRCKNIQFHTYYGLGLTWKRDMLYDIFNHSYDLIVLDELHCAGANLAKQAIKEIMPQLKEMGIHVLGGTATNDRTDGYDPIVDMFDNIQPFVYTMEDMLCDGLAPIPYYSYSTMDAINDVKQYIHGSLEELPDYINKAEFEESLKTIEASLLQVSNAADIIRKSVLDVYMKEPDYMKFLLYFPTCRVLEEKRNEMIQHFQTAFPNKHIRSLTVYSKGTYSKNITHLEEFKYTDNIIDLIFAVNQLNLGYHVEDLTGVCLMRITRSAVIGKQQAYRPISVGSKYPGIILDFVNSLHKQFMFDIPMNQPVNSRLSGVDPLNKKRVANITVHNRVVDIQEMLSNLEGVISEKAEKQICEMYDMSGMPIDLIPKRMGPACNRSRVRNVLLKYGMIDKNEHRLTLYGKKVI